MRRITALHCSWPALRRRFRKKQNFVRAAASLILFRNRQVKVAEPCKALTFFVSFFVKKKRKKLLMKSQLWIK